MERTRGQKGAKTKPFMLVKVVVKKIQALGKKEKPPSFPQKQELEMERSFLLIFHL